LIQGPRNGGAQSNRITDWNKRSESSGIKNLCGAAACRRHHRKSRRERLNDNVAEGFILRRQHKAARGRISVPWVTHIAAPIDAARNAEALRQLAERRLFRTLAVDQEPRVGARQKRHRLDQGCIVLLGDETPESDHCRRAGRQRLFIGNRFGAIDRYRIVDSYDVFACTAPILHGMTNELVGDAYCSRRPA
jgi:hypothetical protein